MPLKFITEQFPLSSLIHPHLWRTRNCLSSYCIEVNDIAFFPTTTGTVGLEKGFVGYIACLASDPENIACCESFAESYKYPVSENKPRITPLQSLWCISPRTLI